MRTSGRPLGTARHASRKAAEPVADAFSTCWTGMPVSPTSFMARVPLMTGAKMYPTYAAWTSRNESPASRSAARPASRPMSAFDRSGNMPNRCMPTPRTATSFIDILRSRSWLHRPEADDHDVLAVLLAQRVELCLDRLADAVVLLPPGERQLDARPLGQVDLADAVADVLQTRRAE